MVSLPYQNPQALDFNRESPYKQACFTLCNFVTFNFLILILLQILLPEQGTPGDRKATWSCMPGYTCHGSSLEGIGSQKEINSVSAFEKVAGERAPGFICAFPLSLAHMCSLLLADEEGPPVCWQSLAKRLVHLGLCMISEIEDLMSSVVWKLIDLWKRKIRKSSHLYLACLKKHVMIPWGFHIAF